MILVLDTETTGADAFSKVFMVSTSQKTWEWRINVENRQPHIPIEDVKEILQTIKDADLIIGHNIKFDYVMLVRTLGKELERIWEWEKVEDTLIASHILNSSESHDLTSLVKNYLDVDISDYENKLRSAVIDCRRLVKPLGWAIALKGNALTPSATNEPWKQDLWLPRECYYRLQHVPEEYERLCREYSECDVLVTSTLWKLFTDLIRKRGLKEIYKERLKLLPIVAEMELSGIGFSLERAYELEEKLDRESNKAKRTIQSIAKKYGIIISVPDSGINNAIRDFAISVLGIKVSKTDKGNPSLCRENLQKVLEQYSENSYEGLFIKSLLEFRKLATAKEYLKSYERYFRFGKLYPSLNPCGTKTLRWSCKYPNQQNVSKSEELNLRYCFSPPEGYVWYSFDAENIELRIPAYESQEYEMVDVFENPDKPPFNGSYHLLIASIIWPEEFELCIKEGVSFKERFPQLYKWTKNGNFAVIYGASDKTIDLTYHKEGASQIIRQRFSKLSNLADKIRNFARKHGYVETIPDKDVNPYKGYPLVIPTDSLGRFSPTLPFNYHIQGTACWWICRTMVEAYPLIKELKGKIILQIHDEILVEIPKDYDSPEIPERIKAKLESVNGIGVPVKVSYERFTESWGGKL